jgi:hypothetical protein
LFASCSQKPASESRSALGGKAYGGTFKFMSLEKVNYLFPMHSRDIYSQRINTQIYESLFKESPDDQSVVPHLIESYKKILEWIITYFQIKKEHFFS